MTLSFDDRFSVVHYQMTDSDRHRKFLIRVKTPRDFSEIHVIAYYDGLQKRIYYNNERIVLGTDIDALKQWAWHFVNKEKIETGRLDRLYKESDGQ